MSNMTGANKTPLGKFNPGFGAPTPAFQSAGSLLKPNYSGPIGPSGQPLLQEVKQEVVPDYHMPLTQMEMLEQKVQVKREFDYVPPPNVMKAIKREPEFENHYGKDDSSSKASTEGSSESKEERRKKRKSRWGDSDSERVIIPGMPTMLPPNLSADQERIYLLQLQIEEVSRRLRTGDLGIPANPEERSPSPEPIYNNEGKRLNTREFRTRKRLEDDRHSLIQQMIQINPAYKPPADYKPPQQKISEKVLIPQEEYPDINFVGLLIGPRGNTLKAMEKDTNAKIIIRGKGSVKEGKIGRKDGQPMPGEDEPLHAFVTGSTHDSVTRAVAKIREVIRQGIEVPENQNDLRRNQLRELALLNGTLRESDGPRCSNCGSSAHRSWQCPDKPNVTNNVVCSNCGGTGHISRDCKDRNKPAPGSAASSKIDEEYMSLMAELGQGPPPPPRGSSGHTNSYSSSGGGSGFSGASTHAQAPRAIMAPQPPPPPSAPQQPPPPPPGGQPPSHSGLLPTPPGQNSVAGGWNRDAAPQQQSAYWNQSPAAALYAGAATGAYDAATYAHLYAQQPAAANWMQGAWANAASAIQQPTNAWAAYVPPPPPPPPPPPM